LTSQVSVIDTPGLEPTLHPLLALFGLGRTNQATIGHLLPVLAALPEEYYAQLESTYSVPALIRPVEGNRFVDATRDLLVHVARKFGRMGKSGPNLESAAEIVGSDVVSGKIRWWIEPPKTTKKTKKSK
jgi:ribosome biogenesis GTPase A